MDTEKAFLLNQDCDLSSYKIVTKNGLPKSGCPFLSIIPTASGLLADQQ